MLTISSPMTRYMYKIIPEHSLILEFLSGDVCINDAIEMKMCETNDVRYNPNYHSIVCLENIKETEVSIIETVTYINILRSGVKVINNRKYALLLNSKDRSTLSDIYRLTAHELPLNFKIVETISEALNWLEISEKIEDGILDYFQSESTLTCNLLPC